MTYEITEVNGSKVLTNAEAVIADVLNYQQKAEKAADIIKKACKSVYALKQCGTHKAYGYNNFYTFITDRTGMSKSSCAVLCKYCKGLESFIKHLESNEIGKKYIKDAIATLDRLSYRDTIVLNRNWEGLNDLALDAESFEDTLASYLESLRQEIECEKSSKMLEDKNKTVDAESDTEDSEEVKEDEDEDVEEEERSLAQDMEITVKRAMPELWDAETREKYEMSMMKYGKAIIIMEED